MPAPTPANDGKVKFATQLSADVLMQLKETAKKEGRQIQAVLDEALREYFHSPCHESLPCQYPPA